MNFVISLELANLILEYLKNKPYSEVANMITNLQSLQKVNIIPQTKEGDVQNVQSTETEGGQETGSQETSGEQSNG